MTALAVADCDAAREALSYAVDLADILADGVTARRRSPLPADVVRELPGRLRRLCVECGPIPRLH